MTEPEEPCCFDEWQERYARRSRKKGTAGSVTASLLADLESAGLSGRTLLDVGCGVGDLAVEAVLRGATGASGIDMSTTAIDEARRLSRERGVADRTEFQVGDGARVELQPHDVVVLNRVFCCYPDVGALLANSVSAAASVYAFSIPPSSGLAGGFVRAQTALSNVWYRIRESQFHGFRAFVHDVDAIDRRVRDAGFRPVAQRRRRFTWHLAVYARA
jgi:predicted RNA methylase